MTKRITEAGFGPFRYDLIPPGGTVLCALSGGADSMYLLCRLLEGAERGRYTVRAAHLNHGLRAAADREEDFVRDWCAKRGVPLAVGQADVSAFAARKGLSLEEGGRVLRYDFLEETARRERCTLIATGHHAGDNAETVLMNLIRGCGLNGLTGIPERRGNIIRPMLGVTREEIRGYLTARGVPHVEDESNADEKYTRNKIRRRLLPLLEELNPQAAAHIVRTAARLARDEEELSRQAAALLERSASRPDGEVVPASALTDAPRPIALRAAARLLERAGVGGYGAVHLEGALALAAGESPSARLDVPGGTVRREYGLLVFAPAGREGPPSLQPLAQGRSRWGSWTVSCQTAVCPAKAYVSPGEFYLRPDAYCIRSRQTGDRVKLGRRPVKTVKALLMEGKIPAARRDHVPVLAHGGGAAALGGFGPDRDSLASPGETALHIILSEERES